MSRELTLGENRAEAIGKGHKRKRSTTGVTKKRKPKVVLDAKAQKQLEGLDPATRAFLESQMK